VVPADHARTSLQAVAAQQTPLARAAYEEMRFDEAIGHALAISGRGNQYINEVAPWTALKKGTDEEKAAARACPLAVAEAARVVAVLLKPITPALARKIYTQLGFTDAQYDALTLRDAE
jgi:methionyl-tRNA synthetase